VTARVPRSSPSGHPPWGASQANGRRAVAPGEEGARSTINDLVADAEWTGGIFDATGKRFFVSIQHNMTGFGVILEIDGWN
jgi:hypothetical protein